MPIIKDIDGFSPIIGSNCFIAENATLIGQVTIGNNCSVWYGCVLRGDAGAITIGDNTNIQDGSVIHCSEGKSKTVIGDNVTIGHNAIVHGSTIKDNVMIGIGATVLDNATVNTNTIVAANALILSGSILEPNSIYAGIPAKKVKEHSTSSKYIEDSANHYTTLKNKYISD